MKKKIIGILFLSLLMAAGCAVLPPPPQAETRNAEVKAAHGMVASAHPLASQAGVEILKMGGNAVDAAVAAAFAVGAAEPNASGLGGEGVMVIYLAKTKTAVSIDYKSAAPAAAVFPKGAPAAGHAAAAVPGTVAGLTLALEKYGTMKLPQVLAPAIKIAEDGFAASATLTAIIRDDFEDILKNRPLARIFCPEDLPLEAGDRVKNPDLAASLRRIAAGGRDVFYRGELAEAIAAEMKAEGGFITLSDLGAYRAVERSPVRGSYRGYDLISAPPPVGGLAVVETLQILESFDLGTMAPLGAERIHVMAEAMRRGSADWRAFVGDPDFVKVPTAELLAKSYAKARAAEIDRARLTEKAGPGKLGGDGSPSTTSLSVVDREGNLVALTQTISDFFGAKVAVVGTGIILNNEMRNFSASGVNTLAPGKRMRTTVAPTIVLKEGRAFATLGTPGAARILTTMPILISNLVDYKMGIQEAIDMPRFFPGETDLAIEPRFPEATVAALAKLGYAVKPRDKFDLFFGGAQGILVDAKTGMKIGGADPRRDGAVVGY